MIFKESSTVELKSQLNQDFKKEVIAFANTSGGTIYVGISDDGDVLGLSEPTRVAESIGNMIRDSISPDLTPYTQISVESVQNCEIVKVDVQSGVKKPYHIREKGLKPSGVFLRHGLSSVPATEDAIRTMIRDTDGTAYDKMRSLEQELTFDYTSQYFKEKGIPFELSHQKTLGIVDSDGFFSHTGLLFSDQCGHIIRCGVYEGVTKEVFRARKEFSGSILKQLEDAYAYLELLNPLGSTFHRLRRIDHYAYDLQSIREALVNAIVHRDYDFSGPILIHIHDDRMEFVSLGGLVKGMTEQDLYNNISQCRNPLIAGVFFRLELIESYGSGISRICSSYQDYPLKPLFKPSPASFVVTLPNRKLPTPVVE